MNPYHIQSSFYQAWVDLDAIQAVYDVQVLNDTFWAYKELSPGMFSIQFAFQDNSKLVSTFTRVNYNERDPVKKEAMFAKVLAEIAELRKVHDELVRAWIGR